MLLKQICEVLHRFVVWSSAEQSDFVALWVAHTYVFGLFDTTPYLDVSSAAKRSGKSRLLEILAMLVARPWPVVEASEAVLFRKVDRDRPDAAHRRGRRHFREGLQGHRGAAGHLQRRDIGSEPRCRAVSAPTMSPLTSMCTARRRSPAWPAYPTPCKTAQGVSSCAGGPATNPNRNGCACPRSGPSCPTRRQAAAVGADIAGQCDNADPVLPDALTTGPRTAARCWPLSPTRPAGTGPSGAGGPS